LVQVGGNRERREAKSHRQRPVDVSPAQASESHEQCVLPWQHRASLLLPNDSLLHAEMVGSGLAAPVH
jgi:hypothetical protein